MAITVNLLKQTRVLTEKQYQVERKVLIIGVVMFCMSIVGVGMAYGWQLLVSGQVTKLDTQIATLTSQYDSLHDANVQQFYIKSRLKLIGDFLTSRGQIREALQRIFALSLPGVTISGASFSNNEMHIQAIADSILSLDHLYQYMETDNGFFTKVVNQGVGRSEKGEYTIGLVLTLPKEGSSNAQ